MERDRMDWKDFLIKFCIFIVFICFFRFMFKNIDYIVDYIDNMVRGEKTVQEGEFTILDKNITNTRVFLASNNTFTLTLESNTKERERYVVDVSDTVYQSYFVNDKIKATLETYSKNDTCNLLEVKGVVANE